jgi:phosphatidylglycerol:prolipoprotein diacylglycerol transferase
MPTGFNIGPFTIHTYGILIILGILLALVVIRREAARRSENLDVLIDSLPWIFIGGLIGARIWHILTPPQSMVNLGITTRYYLTHLNEAIAIWKGGVGIFGAVIGGTTAFAIYCSTKKLPFSIWLDIISPGLALAQAVGRWGNYVNQEVYGLPSDLPWAITIDPPYRLPEYSQVATYHPLFLYESLWSLINMVFLLWASRRYQDRLKPGGLFLIYLIFYGVGRIGLEFLRLDISAYRGVNLNQSFIGLVVLVAGILLYIRQKRTPR